jgi:hypothetical protein
LHIVNNRAESVRSLFQLYFSVGSIMRLRNISSLRVFGFSFVSMARANRWIVGQDIWEQVEDRLRSHLDHTRTKRMRQTSDTPLVGKFFDDRGNRMSPSWARKGSKRVVALGAIYGSGVHLLGLFEMRRSSPIARGEAAIFNRGGGARRIGLRLLQELPTS